MADVGKSLVNMTRQFASKAYKQAVPVLTASNLTQVGDAILGFTPIYNEFISVFFNKVTLEIMDSRRYRNPFRSLTKGSNALGGVIQNTQVNPAQAQAYDVNATSRLLQNYKPDVAVEYYNLNRKDVFAVTRARQEMELAFTSFENLDRFFSELIDSLYNGNEVREFDLYKALMASAYLDDVVRKVPIKTPVDAETAKTFVAALQQYQLAFQYPSSNYNNYQALAAKAGYSVTPRVVWSEPDQQIIIMDSRLAPVIGLNVLASAFNVEYAQLHDRVLYVDDFAVTGLLAIIADVDWLQVRDAKREFRDFENGATLTLNSFFHVWQYYNICTFKNAIALYDPDAKPITISINDVTESPEISVAVNSSSTAPVSLTYDGNDVTDGANVNFISSTNNMVFQYNAETKQMQVVTNKYSLPGDYTVLVTAAINNKGTPLSNSTILTVHITG